MVSASEFFCGFGAAQVQEEEVVGNFESLSQYKAKFQAELPSAPAPAED